MRVALVCLAAVACGHRSPQPPVEQKPDPVTPLTAAGLERPKGLDWGPEGAKPAAQLFTNVKLLGNVSGDRFMAAMQSMEANLGFKCAKCHEEEKKDYASDAREEKSEARRMIRMTWRINESTFKSAPVVTCWMCHRGKDEPDAKVQGLPEVPPEFPKLSEADQGRPTQEVFKNIQVLKDMPAQRLGRVMAFFAQQLGVKCTDCHVEKDFASDKKDEKQRAREMLGMVTMLTKEFYDGKSTPIHCGTCHRGHEKPERAPGKFASIPLDGSGRAIYFNAPSTGQGRLAQR